MTDTGHNRSAGANEPLVRFENVQKTYDGEILVVKDLNLDVERGEFLTLLGPSGSGKTTTLMMLAGFESATHGDITLDGRSLMSVPPHKRDIGMVFQNYALFPHMTVHENLAFPLQCHGVDKNQREAKIGKVLEMVELTGFERRRPAQLSGGQQQRVALARALVFEPRIVLMDEPLGALDKKLREQMQLEMKHIHENVGLTFVYVTHDQSEALTMSNRIAVFDDGVIQQLDGPEELYEHPQNAFVAQFIGENNRLTGTIKDVSGEYCQVELPSGDTVKALAVNISGVGDTTTLSLRPEAIVLDATDGDGCDDIYTATIRESIYMGDHVRVRVSACGNDDFVIKVPRGAGGRTMNPGEEIKIGWRSQDCRALDAA
ncbi:MAG: spermidine/putrescine ABC transporter ATP-binding protein [Rhodospirillaceae bacterium]|nr:spermidine/putrescine ABC transporter ATP-binding protein [Rhodospirillaceae bacterium]|tara:strand:+ start:9400 stop:10521 length:1122 start_codon:yes stop_codon:yes gene_type:complete